MYVKIQKLYTKHLYTSYCKFDLNPTISLFVTMILITVLFPNINKFEAICVWIVSLLHELWSIHTIDYNAALKDIVEYLMHENIHKITYKNHVWNMYNIFLSS